MNNFITHIFSIKNHPISALSLRYREQYIKGLGEFMCYMTESEKQAKFLFDIWVHSILGTGSTSAWLKTNNCSKIKSALSLKREGLRFFVMWREFFFDCFYLMSIVHPKSLQKVYDFLLNQIGFMPKRTLKKIYTNWNNLQQLKISSNLLKHREINQSFQNKSLKKILVVATMTAGKSTLINAIVGHKIAKTATTVCTNKLCYIYNKPIDDGIVVKESDGHLVYNHNMDLKKGDSVKEIGLHFNSSLLDSCVCLIDTPGTNYSEDESHGEITRKAIESNDYSAIVFVVNSLQFNTVDEATLRKYTISHTKKPIIFVLNKLDCFNPEDDSIQDMVGKLYAILKDSNVKPIIVPMSANYALLLKIANKGLGIQEQMQFDLLKNLFQYDYYNLPQYSYDNKGRMGESNNEIEKTGITLLEKIIKSV